MAPRTATHTRARIAATIMYFVMVAVNGLANALPLNGRTTGAISDDYENLFAPAGFTFAIWGVIYVALALHVAYLWGLIPGLKRPNVRSAAAITWLFAASSFANTCWIFAWHYDHIGLSLLLIITMLLLLLAIVSLLHGQRLNSREKLFWRVPFALYCGWITVAMVANVTVFLVSLGWDAFMIISQLVAAVIVVVAAIIGSVAGYVLRDYAYLGVMCWAYVGIVAKHLSGAGFGGSYPLVAATAMAGLGLVAATIAARAGILPGARR